MYYKQVKIIVLVFIATLPLLVQGQINYGSNNGKFLTIRGTKIYYEEYGKGIPLLMLHGGFGDISDFQKVIPKLSEKYRVIIPDAYTLKHNILLVENLPNKVLTKLLY